MKFITAFADTQDNRLEVLVVGWSFDEESYVILHHVIYGNPSTDPKVWQELDQLRAMTFKLRGVDDRVLRIQATGVDMAGHNTAAVLAYANTRNVAGLGRVFATHGIDGPVPLWPHRGSISKAKRRETFFNIGVSSGKELVTARLAMTPPLPGFRKPGFIHFPIGLDEEFYLQLNSERQLRRTRNGQEVTYWQKVRERNDAFDCMVGALCVRRYFGRLVGGGNLAIDPRERMPNIPTVSAPPPAPPTQRPIPSPAAKSPLITSPSTDPADTTALDQAIEAEDDEVVKIEFEKFIMAHLELTDEDLLSSMREAAEAAVLDPLTTHAREETRKLGIGDFDKHKLGKIKPPVVPEEIPDADDVWLKQILEKRRALIAAQPQSPTPAPGPPPPPRSWVRPPRRHGLYAALDDD